MKCISVSVAHPIHSSWESSVHQAAGFALPVKDPHRSVLVELPHYPLNCSDTRTFKTKKYRLRKSGMEFETMNQLPIVNQEIRIVPGTVVNENLFALPEIRERSAFDSIGFLIER